MRRRDLLAALGAGTAGLAGCAGLETEPAGGSGSGGGGGAPPLAEDRPDAVYRPTHVEGMAMVGRASQGPYECALTYTYPHRFWLVTGTRVERVSIREEDSVHLMPVLWDAETGTVPPDLNPTLSIEKGDWSTSLSPWPMLSQPMGFHFGDNVALDGEGTYAVTASAGSPSTRRTGALADNEGGVEFTFDFEFSRADLGEIMYRDVPPEEEGTAGAVDPMAMDAMPSTRVPAADAMPGDVRGSTASGDAEFVVTVLDDATPYGGGEGESYLAVSPRTPYNRYMLPLLSLSGALSRAGDTVFEGVLQSTIDPDLGYHYGAAVSGVEAGDELALAVDAPPQAARHEGYETAFVEMPGATLTL